MTENEKKIFHTIFTLFLSLLFPMTHCAAQIPEKSTQKNTVRSIAATVFDDVNYVASTPFHMSTQDALRCTAVATITTACIMSYDARMDKNFKDGDDGIIILGKKLAKIGYRYDKISPAYVLGGLATGLFVTGLVCKNKKLVETTRLMVESLAITEVITGVAKEIVGRSRPYTGKGPHDFTFFRFDSKTGHLSMPSGHTSTIFSMMTVIAKQYNHWWVKIPAYTAGLSVALQRIDAHQHWTSDVIVGGSLGFWVGSALVNGNRKKSQNVSFCPYLLLNAVGLTVHF
jgi:membrane-associated phospholipid phosphatase